MLTPPRILFVDRENKIFGERVDPNTKLKLKPTQSFVLFRDLIFPKHLISEYLEEFNKMQNFSKDLPEEDKVVFF